MDKSYTFPFSTCEKPSDGLLAQPYSVFFNIIGCIIIIYYLNKAKTNSSKMLLFALFLFEAFHTFSHSIHLNNNSQIIFTHGLTYVVNFCLLITLFNYSKHFPNDIFLLYLFGLVIFDQYALQNLPFFYYFFCQILIFISLIIYYYEYLPNKSKEKLPIIILLISILLFLEINEFYNCKKILKEYDSFPIHIFIEIIGAIIFYFICDIFYEL